MEIVQLLLCRNANVNVRDRLGRTPLHSASMDGHTQVAQLLQEYGAEVDAQEFHDDTFLTLASYFEKFEVVRLLLGVARTYT